MADVFISYSSKDEDLANHICEELEKKGLTCWIAPRNVTFGQDWAASISNAIPNSKVMLLIYSKNSAASTQVPRELSIAEKMNCLIMPYKVDDAELTGAFNYYLTSCHWIEADPANGEYKIDEMFATISGYIEASKRNTINNTYIDKLTINNQSPMQGTPTEMAAQAVEAARSAVQPSDPTGAAVGSSNQTGAAVGSSDQTGATVNSSDQTGTTVGSSAQTGAAAGSSAQPQTDKQPSPQSQNPQDNDTKKKSGSGLAVIAIVLAVIVAIALPIGCFGCMFLFSE